MTSPSDAAARAGGMSRKLPEPAASTIQVCEDAVAAAESVSATRAVNISSPFSAVGSRSSTGFARDHGADAMGEDGSTVRSLGNPRDENRRAVGEGLRDLDLDAVALDADGIDAEVARPLV